MVKAAVCLSALVEEIVLRRGGPVMVFPRIVAAGPLGGIVDFHRIVRPGGQRPPAVGVGRRISEDTRIVEQRTVVGDNGQRVIVRVAVLPAAPGRGKQEQCVLFPV